MECAARLLQETRVLMAAHQSGISPVLGLTQLGLRSKNVSLCRSEDRNAKARRSPPPRRCCLTLAPLHRQIDQWDLCVREREEKRVSQQGKEGNEGSFDKMDNSLRAGWSMAAITPGEACMYKFEPVECPSLQSQPSEFLNKGKEGKGIPKLPASGINKHEIGKNRPHLRPICCLKGGWL